MKKILYIGLSFILCLTMIGCQSEEKTGPSNISNSIQNRTGDQGFDMKSIIQVLQSAGAVKSSGKSIQLKDIDSEEAIQYDNMVIVKFALSESDYFDAYESGQLSVNGETWYVHGAAGPYLLFSIDNQPNEAIVKSFEGIVGIPYSH